MAVDARPGNGPGLPVVTLVNGTGTSVLSYTLAAGETMEIEAVVIDADGLAAVANTTFAVEFLAPSGEVIAESSTNEGAIINNVYTVTFAPFLTDAFFFPGGLARHLQTALVPTKLPGGATVRVTAAEATWTLTEARIWATPGRGDEAEYTAALYLLPALG